MMAALISEVAGTTLFAYVIGALVSIVLNLNPQDRLRKQQVKADASERQLQTLTRMIRPPKDANRGTASETPALS